MPAEVDWVSVQPFATETFYELEIECYFLNMIKDNKF